ncbi:protein translocase subunit SecDF [Desulfogranum japonicum]|uniref:protein translocase subunit SecDF n=1 Tax=Desulfogranum japonicum TaxID=231447 RepID=UPI00048C88BC|nr:protein translocase subunit SecDF [Desulfogranum japonicum]
MNTTLKLKIGMLVMLVLFSVVTLVPSFDKEAPSWWKTYLAPQGLKLGLDLQGGLHLVLQVDLEKAVENSLNLAAQDLKEGLAEKKITAVQLKSDHKDRVIFTLPSTSAVETVKQVLDSDFPNLSSEIQAEPGTFPRVTLKLTDEQISHIKKNAVSQSLEIIRNRVDQFGVGEPVIVRQGENEIVVQLPGEKDPERAEKLIGQTAQLSFKLVADSQGLNLGQIVNDAIQAKQWNTKESLSKLNHALQSRLPKGTAIYFEREIDPQTQQVTNIPMLLEEQILMTGEMVKDAQVRVGGTFNQPYVSLDLTGRGGKKFADVTEKNVGRRLAIVLDDVVRSAPRINEAIYGGSAQITGRFTHEEATDLSIVLRAGALPTDVKTLQKLTVGASLGADSIKKGLLSGLYGALMVLGFMVIYYRLSGVVANISLALNILFLFVGLAMLSATLTLPGIAGIILSIGMAVDANVLIFERMREEFSLGKSVKSGIDAGFSKAFWSIVDSQVTTLITAMALFLFGTGPIKGFAVTLSLGIIFNLFAVLFCSRLIFDSLFATARMKKLNFMHLVKNASFDFMKARKIAFTFSTVLVLLGTIAFVQILRGHANLGVDFTGGSLLQYKSELPFALADIRNSLKENGYPNIDLQEVTGEHRLIVKMKKQEEHVGHLGDALTNILVKDFPDNAFTLESQSEIGSSISEVLRNKAVQAIAISLFGVLCYLALRFDFSFGLAAAAATLHDVLAVLGICWLTNMEITLLIVTALLTLAGYSLNDSVVVFDRIRENMSKEEEEGNLLDTINTSINQVLGRSVVTSLTTALVLLSLFLFGGTTIHNFSAALLIGIIVGTYSSIFIASPLLTLKSR